MKTNINKLKGKLVENQKTTEQIAKAVGMDKSTFYRKVKSDGLKFTIAEVHKIVETIPLTEDEAIDIFLAN